MILKKGGTVRHEVETDRVFFFENRRGQSHGMTAMVFLERTNYDLRDGEDENASTDGDLYLLTGRAATKGARAQVRNVSM